MTTALDEIGTPLMAPVASRPARDVLRCAVAAQRDENAARVRLLQLARDWALLHGALDAAASPALPGAERLVPFGGEGTPEVAEFCAAELGAALSLSPHAARSMMADALDLVHRLPRVWARVVGGEAKPWVAQQLAAHTRDLSLQVVAMVDRIIAPYLPRLGWGRVRSVVDGLAIEADPEAARERAARAAAAQGVWVGPSTDHGLKEVFIRAEAADAIWFDAAVTRVADSLAALGDSSPRDRRRAHAIGIIAQPQRALDLYADAAAAAGNEVAPMPVDLRDGISAADPAVAPGHSAVVAPPAAPGGCRHGSHDTAQGGCRHASHDTAPRAVLYVHITDLTLREESAVARVEEVGAVLAEQARSWLQGCAVVVKPVVDLRDQAPVDAHEIPARLREAVALRSPADCFPFASGVGRRGDIDHTVPFVEGGPPGQTRLGNLAPLTRFHHRVKTHGRWQVRQPFDGVLVWRSPGGHHYLVDHTGTRSAAGGAGPPMLA